MSHENHPEAKIHQKKGIPLFWIVPVLAVCITGYLIYQTISERGLKIEIVFPEVKGLKAGKTSIKYEGVTVGMVDDVELSKDLKNVIVTAHIYNSARELARTDSKFWIVSPQVGIEGISGLDTIIAGNYIAVQGGQGELATRFKGLKTKPNRDPNSADLYLKLISNYMPSVQEGSPIQFKKYKIGIVENLEFNPTTLQSEIEIRIKKRYKNLVRENSVFADKSGIDINISLSGVNVKSDSVMDVLFGAIMVGTPDQKFNPAPLAKNDMTFTLYPSPETALKATAKMANTTEGQHAYVIQLILEDGSGIISEKTQLRYKGVPIGHVQDMEFSEDGTQVLANATLDRKLKHLAQDGTRFIMVYPEVQLKGMSRLNFNPQALIGAYIRVEDGAGSGEPKDQFHVSHYEREKFQPMSGLHITLLAHQLGKLSQTSPIYYRGVQVGQVESFQLASDGSAVEIQAVIEKHYAPLVRSNSQFWNNSGIDAQISLWGGVKVKTESFSSVFEGGISFLTPNNDEMGPVAEDGSSFTLNEKPDKKWSKWAPSIPLDP